MVTLYVDADDTILDSSKAVIEILNEKYNLSPAKTILDLEDWNYHSICDEVTPAEVTEIYNSKDFFDRVKIKKGFENFWRKHKDKFYKQINAALEKNDILHMYPEGSLWPYYENIRDFKYGAFKIAVEANKPIQPIRFVFVNPDGIQKLYKRKKCIHAIILPAIYPDEALEYKERIEDLRNKTYDAICKGGN